MIRDTKKTIARVAARLFTFSVEDYLVSEDFSRFCREHDLDDIWKESLDLSRDRPDLYGDATIKNAFIEFLHHAFRKRPEEFPELFIRFLTGFTREISRPLPLDDLKKDLTALGCPAEDLERKFLELKTIGEENLKRRTIRCPD